MKIIIIGAGLTGISAARQLTEKKSLLIFDKNKTAGGLCRTIREDNFSFDYTGHFFHFNNKKIKKHFISPVADIPFLKVERKSFINITNRQRILRSVKKNDTAKRKEKQPIRGCFLAEHSLPSFFSEAFFKSIPYPFQSHLFYLPEKIRKECLMEYLKNLKRAKSEINGTTNFYNWMLDYFGEGIVKYFMLPYNKKMWTLHPRFITTEWMSRFVPRPLPEEVISGAVCEGKSREGYNAFFYYPPAGIGKFSEKFAEGLNINFESSVDEVNWKEKTVTVKGIKYPYDFLISTAPLKNLVADMLNPKDEILLKYATKLKNTGLLNINIGWKGEPGKAVKKGTHWIYFPGSEVFYRVGFPPAISRRMAPKGNWSCYVEISYPSDKLPDKTKYQLIENKVIYQLIKSEIIPSDAEIVKTLTLTIPTAYVIYDKSWRKSHDFLIEHLETLNIFTGGRYGGWEYSSMEEAIIWGRRLSEKCLSK